MGGYPPTWRSHDELEGRGDGDLASQGGRTLRRIELRKEARARRTAMALGKAERLPLERTVAAGRRQCRGESKPLCRCMWCCGAGDFQERVEQEMQPPPLKSGNGGRGGVSGDHEEGTAFQEVGIKAGSARALTHQSPRPHPAPATDRHFHHRHSKVPRNKQFPLSLCFPSFCTLSPPH